MISASLVKELREKTGAGMLDCKKALEEYLNTPEEVRSLTKLGSKYNIKRQTLSERFKKWGYEIINQQNKCRLNENCFDNMNTEE